MRDMWLTGFDSPSLHTMYVDKPMQGAGLMQAIARVNRTFRDKPGGLVVDYIGIAENLRTALADYTNRDREHQEVGAPVQEALNALEEAHEILCFLLIDCPWREALDSGLERAKIEALQVALEYILGDADKSLADRFLEHPALAGQVPLSARRAGIGSSPGYGAGRDVGQGERPGRLTSAPHSMQTWTQTSSTR